MVACDDGLLENIGVTFHLKDIVAGNDIPHRGDLKSLLPDLEDFVPWWIKYVGHKRSPLLGLSYCQ